MPNAALKKYGENSVVLIEGLKLEDYADWTQYVGNGCYSAELKIPSQNR
jgi:hypothetical protein